MRLGTSAGAVVFFSAQQATRARAYGDLTRFHEVLYAHLNLGEAERLRSELERELEEQFEIHKQRAQDLQSAEAKLQEQLKDTDARLEEILRNPPWELAEEPTRVMSETRIRSFAEDLASEAGRSVDGAWEPPVALDHAETWVRDLSGKRSAEREHVVVSINAQLQRLSKQLGGIRAAKDRETQNTAAAAELNRQLAELCDGGRVDELEARLETASAQLTKEERSALALKTVAPLLGQDTDTCPICGLACNGADLLHQVTERIQQAGSAGQQAAEEVQGLVRQKKQAQSLASQTDAATRAAEAARAESEQLMAQVGEELGCSPHA